MNKDISCENNQLCKSVSSVKDASTQTKNNQHREFGMTLPVSYEGMDREEEDEIQTSDFYKTRNLPWRFEHPAKWNYGNAVFTCTNESAEEFSKKIDLPAPATWLRGWFHQHHHPLYQTTSMSYGSQPPTVHTVPMTYFPVKTKFSEHLAMCGMYRNRSLNTAIDRSKV